MLGFCPQLVEEPFPPYGQLRVCFSFISSFSDVNQWCGRGAVRGAETACVYVCWQSGMFRELGQISLIHATRCIQKHTNKSTNKCVKERLRGHLAHEDKPP